MKGDIASRGKWAEGRMKKFLKLQELANAVHHRFPDARAGSLVTTPSDFMFMKSGILTLIEVKEVDHNFRLPHKNFSTDKVARMRMWKAAGAHSKVVIYFRPLNKWRTLDIDAFQSRLGGSWDFSVIPLCNEVEAFELAVIHNPPRTPIPHTI